MTATFPRYQRAEQNRSTVGQVRYGLRQMQPLHAIGGLSLTFAGLNIGMAIMVWIVPLVVINILWVVLMLTMFATSRTEPNAPRPARRGRRPA